MQFSFVIKDNFALIFAQYYHGLINFNTVSFTFNASSGLAGFAVLRLYDGQPFLFRRIT
jgi:hypothetical protein